MSNDQRMRDLNEEKRYAIEQERTILDRIQQQKRSLTAAERQTLERIDTEITGIDRQRDQIITSGWREEVQGIDDEYRRIAGGHSVDAARRDEGDVMRRFMRGEGGATLDIDLRRASYAHELYRAGARGDQFRSGVFGDSGASGGSLTIPSLVSSNIFMVMNAANVMRRMRTTILTTDGGGPLAVPVGTPGAATQIANQDTTFTGTDPTMASKNLRAFDVGQLVAIGNDLIEDTAVDISSWVADSIAVSVGALEEQWWVTGTGSNQPTGIMTSACTGASGTIATGGSLILGPSGAVGEKLIDVVYGVNNVYRQNAEWLMRDATTATVRKLRDGAGGTIGAFLFQPSTTAGLPGGEPDRLLGFPHFSSSNVAAMGSDAHIAAFGDFSRFVAREVRGFRLERSQDYLFGKNQTAVRGLTRTDSVLTDVTAVVKLHQAVT